MLDFKLNFSSPIFFLIFSLATAPLHAQSAPTETLINHYEAIKNGNCQKAIELRPGYTENRCRSIKIDSDPLVELKVLLGNKALVFLSLNYLDNEVPITFKGCVELFKKETNWFIKNDSYKKTTCEQLAATSTSQATDSPQPLEPSATFSEPTDPESVLRSYYLAIATGDCQRAEQLRPGYPEESCRRLQQPQLDSLEKSYDNLEESAVVFSFKITYTDNNNPASFDGFALLTKKNNNWRISDIKKSEQDIREQLNDYLFAIELRKTDSTYSSTPLDTTPNIATDSEPPIEPSIEPRLSLSISPQQAIYNNSNGNGNSLLDICWSPAQLAGYFSTKKIRKIQPPDTSPPPLQSAIDIEKIFPPLPTSKRNSIRYVIPDGNAKIMALTFDLCEQADEITGYDADIVNYLRKNKIPATFYAGGKWMRDHPEETMQLMADPLFEIGNHAWTHGNLRVISGPAMHDQILWTQAQYQLLRNELIDRAISKGATQADIGNIPRAPTTFRFPYGTCNDESLDALAHYGLAAIQWNIVTGDPARNQTAKGIADTVLKNAKPGAIVVAHGNGRGWKTSEALDLFIPALKQRGYRFVTVSDLLASGKVVATETCYELKPGDNKHYDRLFGNGTGAP